MLRQLVAQSGEWSLATPVARRLLSRLRGGYILAFHHIEHLLFVQLVEALRPDRPVSLDELSERRREGRSTGGLFAITVDDGYQDSVPDIARAARDREWPVTFFLPTGYLDMGELPYVHIQHLNRLLPLCRFQLKGEEVDLSDPLQRSTYFAQWEHTLYTRPSAEYSHRIRATLDALVEQGHISQNQRDSFQRPLTWNQVSELASDIVTFESHGVSHDPVICFSEEELEQELVTSKKRIEEVTGRAVNHFCYPYGGDESIGALAPNIVARHFQSAVSMTRGRLANRPSQLLPRIPLYDSDTPAVARLKTLVL